MQAIVTKYLPATNTKGSRVKASCERGSIIVAWTYEGSDEYQHKMAADALIARFVAEDEKRYGTEPAKNPWNRKRVCGGLPSGEYAHVFIS